MALNGLVRAWRVMLLTVVSMAGTATIAGAQSEGTRVPVPHHQIVSANPLLMTFEWFNAEFERKFDETKTWGVSASTTDIGGARYTNASALFRYYPQEAALSGFFIGGRAGLHRAAIDAASGNFFSAGVDIGYTWLLGSRRNVGISIGVGANRLFGGDLDGVHLTLPTLRLLNIGVAF